MTEYPTSVHENNTYNGAYQRTIMTCSNDGIFDFDATNVISATNKHATSSVLVPQSFITDGYTVRSYAKVMNNNQNKSKSNTNNTFTFNSLTGYLQCYISSGDLPALAYTGYTRHEITLNYFTDDDAVLGADIAIYYN